MKNTKENLKKYAIQCPCNRTIELTEPTEGHRVWCEQCKKLVEIKELK